MRIPGTDSRPLSHEPAIVRRLNIVGDEVKLTRGVGDFATEEIVAKRRVD